MALLKSLPLPGGLSAGYHKLAWVRPNYCEGTTEIAIASYADESARGGDKDPPSGAVNPQNPRIYSAGVLPPEDGSLPNPGGIRSWAYDWLVANTEFAGATRD